MQKFVDCRTKDVSRRELYIVEGDSALGSVKLGRDAEFQGIMPVRGKILNCLKADYGKIFKSEIITDLLKVHGLRRRGPATSAAKDLALFDLDNLRWNKIVICTDADVDGFQIRTLILTMLYRLTPTLIQEGYVYIAESPLYEITCKDGKTWFAYSEKEKADILTELDGKKVHHPALQGPGRERPGDDVDDHHEPGHPPAHHASCPRRPRRTARVFDLLLGDNAPGAQRTTSPRTATSISTWRIFRDRSLGAVLPGGLPLPLSPTLKGAFP